MASQIPNTAEKMGFRKPDSSFCNKIRWKIFFKYFLISKWILPIAYKNYYNTINMRTRLDFLLH